MEHTNNQITIRGELEALPVLSHENHGQEFYRFLLAVPRLSGTVDLLPVIAKGAVLSGLDPSAGDMITVTGQVEPDQIRTEEKENTGDQNNQNGTDQNLEAECMADAFLVSGTVELGTEDTGTGGSTENAQVEHEK